MAENAIRRKSFYVTSSFNPNLQALLDTAVRDKLEPGKFLYTITAWIKLCAMLVSAAIFALVMIPSWSSCENNPNYYLTLLPLSIGLKILVQLILFLIFCFGLAVKTPGKWIKADIILNITFAIFQIVVSAIGLSLRIICTENLEMHKFAIYGDMFGSGLTIIGCAAIFMMYRYVEDDLIDSASEQQHEKPAHPRRKSIFA